MLRQIAIALAAASIALAPVLAVAATPVDTVPASTTGKSTKSAKKAGKHKVHAAKHGKSKKLTAKAGKKTKHAKGKNKKPVAEKSAAYFPGSAPQPGLY